MQLPPLLRLFSLLALGGLLGACSPPASTQVSSPLPEELPRGPYPLILYGVPNTDHDIHRARALGFTHVYRSGSGFAGDPADSERMADIQTYLDRAVAHDMKVAFCLDGHRRLHRNEVGLEQMQTIVRRFKEHPAVGFWYLYDEPNLPSSKTKKAMLAARYQEEENKSSEAVIKEVVRPPEVVLPAYEMVKREAPEIPVILMMAISNDAWWRDAWKQFYATYDIVSFDTYPVYATPFPEAPLHQVTTWMERYTEGTDKPVMPCLQIFNWNTLSGRVERAKAAGNTEYLDWRYPNLEELRYWNFSSLVQGAPGIIYYTYGGPDAKRRPPDEWLEGVLKTTTHEIGDFTTEIGATPVRRISLPKGSPLLAGVWQTGEALYLVIANGGGDFQRLIHEPLLAELDRGIPSPWRFTRSDGLERKGRAVAAVNLKPWEVQIWQVR